MEVKRCNGFKGVLYCADTYPDGVPISEFYKSSASKDGIGDQCKICTKVHNFDQHKRNNPKRKIWYSLAGGQKEYYNLPKDYRARIRARAGNVEWKINGKVVSETKRFKFDDKITYSTQKEQIKRNRDSKVVSYIRSVYDSCSVVGCDYLDYDVAHIHALKHGADDLPENCLALCPNHHRDLDRGRMIDLQQLDGGGYIYFGEGDDRQGIDLKHKVDSKYLDRCNLELEEWKNGTNKVYSENDRPSLAVGK